MQSFIRTIVLLLTGFILLFGGASIVSAQTSEEMAAANFSKFGINCGIPFPTGGGGHIADCIPEAIYYLIYVPSGWILTGSAYMFDAMFPLSLSKQFIEQPFIEKTWGIARDVANMAFIFILLYIGISTILGIGKDWKNSVIIVIIVALLINFSLFFTKVIIDAGNMFAVGIYSQLGGESTTPHTDIRETGVPERKLSYTLASYFQPQHFMAATQEKGIANAVVVFIVAAIVSIYVAYVFFRVAFLLISRLIMFWYHMIMSPIAFVSLAFPGGNYFGKWLKGLVHQSFFPVAFLFFMYIIITVISTTDIMDKTFISSSGGEKPSLADTLIVIVLKTVLIMVALQKTLKFSEELAGHAGAMAQEWGGKFLGKKLGMAAIAPTAKIGRALVGRGAEHAFNSDKLRAIASTETPKNAGLGLKAWNSVVRATGRGALSAADTGRKASFDLRGVGLVKSASKAAGVDLGKAGGAGGWSGAQVKWKKDQIEASKRVAVADNSPLYKEKHATENALKDIKKTITGTGNDPDKIKKEIDEDPLVKAESAAKKNAEGAEKDLAVALEKLAEAQEVAAKTGDLAPLTAASSRADAATQVAKEKTEEYGKAQSAANMSATLKTKRDQYKELSEAAKAVEKAGDALEEENKRRRDVYASSVGGSATGAGTGFTTGGVAGGVVGTALAGPVGAAVGAAMGAAAGSAIGAVYGAASYSSKTAKAAADKIRKGEDKDEKAHKEFLKQIGKMQKDAAGSEPAEKKEEPAH